MAEGLTTQLEAVNAMLRAIAEAPVNSITVGNIPADVQIAVDLLADTSRQVQLIGWPWNSERDVLMSLTLAGEVSSQETLSTANKLRMPISIQKSK